GTLRVLTIGFACMCIGSSPLCLSNYAGRYWPAQKRCRHAAAVTRAASTRPDPDRPPMSPARSRSHSDRSRRRLLLEGAGPSRSARRVARPPVLGCEAPRTLRPRHRHCWVRSMAFFFLSSKGTLDAAWLDLASKALLNPPGQLRRTQ